MNRERNWGVYYGFGSARFAARGTDEIEDGFGGFGEISVRSELRMFLCFFYRFQQGSAVPALE